MSIYIQTLDKSRRIDNPRLWAESDIVAAPDFDLPAFQKKIDRVCGKSREGASVIRVSWTWDTERCFSLFFTDWDIEDNPTKSELRAKYLYKRVPVPGGDHVDIPPPRFVFEELIHPAQYYAAWEKNRWQYDPKAKRKVPIRPRAPKTYYRLAMYAALHDPQDACCLRAQKANDECFGLFRLPSPADVDYFARLTGKLNRLNKRRNPYKAFDEKVMQAILEDTEAGERAEEEQKLIREEEDLREFASILRPLNAYSLPTITNAPPVRGEKRSEGGIILPNGF